MLAPVGLVVVVEVVVEPELARVELVVVVVVEELERALEELVVAVVVVAGLEEQQAPEKERVDFLLFLSKQFKISELNLN